MFIISTMIVIAGACVTTYSIKNGINTYKRCK